jgi:very-short-patch-repair endonuclease
MRTKSSSADRRVARIATGQHGVVTVTQLLEAGLSREGIKRRARRGALHRVHRGVYRVGHRAPSTEAHCLAAVLACGEGAVLSGQAAAFVFGLVKGRPPRPEVTAVAWRRVAGVITHRARHLDPRDVTSYRFIPITTVARTVLDLAGSLSLGELARACHEADVRYRVGAAEVDAALARRPNVPGAGKLHEVFHGDARVTLSKLERDFLAVLRSAGLPLPETNRLVGGRYVDCRWPEHQLIVELDGYRFHRSRHAWEQDRRREREARARGDEFRRYTHGDVGDDRTLMLAELQQLLASPAQSGPASSTAVRMSARTRS